MGRAASLETTGVGAAAREEEQEQVVLPDLPPTYSQLDLASSPPSYSSPASYSSPPSYGPDLEMVVVAPPPSYQSGLDYEALVLSIDEISTKWEQMRVK